MDTQTRNENAAPNATIRLADYRPPAWRVTHIELVFDLGTDETFVHSKLTLARDRDEPLFLDGEDVELVEARLDGRKLADNEYSLDAAGLTIPGARDGGVLELDVRIDPAHNSQLCGLYLSGSRGQGFLLTQCEAQGFRRITFMPDRPDVLSKYNVTLRASKERFPVLLAGGEEVASGDLDDGRHYARFVDPHPKPSYLFALVAGHLEKIERAYRTADGHDVILRLWAEADAIDRCDYAMDALERAMRWDEQAYGRNYDLPVFNVVATHDFNMGAMENKGLNIFNSKYLLADPDTTTDDEYRRIEAVIGHEYFHNWSGDRVTCRDWFQLSLKEGFTVFREHSFCADMHSPALKRIEDVSMLRRVQFAEDAGPLAHPVRPAAYQAIDNFYTATVYEKGAELIRMIAGTLGPEGFRRGTDLYFSRFDGQAVTIDDLLTVLGEANGVDLSPYLKWYAQAGTPELEVHGEYDAAAKRYTLSLAQQTPPTAGQSDKQPVPIPVNVALFAEDGSAIPLQRQGEATASATCVLELTAAEQRFVFENVASAPTPSLLRGFSAPVNVAFDYTPAQLAQLLQHETEGFDRWNAAQQLAALAFDEQRDGRREQPATEAWLATLTKLFRTRAGVDPALLADLLTPPSALEFGARHTPFDPDAVHAAREALESALAQHLGGDTLTGAYRELHDGETGDLGQAAAARRRLKGRVLSLLLRADPAAGAPMALAQFDDAKGMTDRLSALSALLRTGAPQAGVAVRGFRDRFDGDALTLDKWFTLNATLPEHATLDRVQALQADRAFNPANPNRVHALFGAFARANPVAFHRPDGAGHRWFAGKLTEIDKRNPQLAARLAKAFEDWPRLEPQRRASAETTLRKLLKRGGHSPDLTEILTRMLAAGASRS